MFKHSAVSERDRRNNKEDKQENTFLETWKLTKKNSNENKQRQRMGDKWRLTGEETRILRWKVL